eukprot:NODE_403_length_1406_cov_172.649963_g297_i0.p2 GENE.NODE_403_length_1406_cov_172.649963_g297_i0~~NODE_403_length_1406_cov_172.649963_g297_i0.p2  ORF type:complete len:155 (+),score=3.50 NODE_403_length_1406_cov_172.649963_g297_i0:470-934(+)
MPSGRLFACLAGAARRGVTLASRIHPPCRPVSAPPTSIARELSVNHHHPVCQHFSPIFCQDPKTFNTHTMANFEFVCLFVRNHTRNFPRAQRVDARPAIFFGRILFPKEKNNKSIHCTRENALATFGPISNTFLWPNCPTKTPPLFFLQNFPKF